MGSGALWLTPDPCDVTRSASSVQFSVRCLRESADRTEFTIMPPLTALGAWSLMTVLSARLLSRFTRCASAFLARVGVPAISDSRVLLRDVRWDTVPDMLSKPSSRSVELA